MSNFEFIGDQRRTFIYKLFRSWHKTLIKYENALAEIGDLPYWYIERTNIGLLAAAALRIEAFPIEEYTTLRGRGVNRSVGRADLWILSPNETIYDFEAKRKEVLLSSNRISEVIEPPLRKAVIAVRSLAQRSNFSVGIVFVIPYASSLSQVNLSLFKEQIIDITSYGGDFAAIHFCNETIWRNLSIKGYFHPGIAVVGKYG